MDNFGKILIISGPRNSGKTTLCQKIVKEFRNKQLEVRGILSPGFYENGIKKAIYVEEINTSNQRKLAKFSPGWDEENTEREWAFNLKALDWGNRVIAQSVPTDILIIDELGYLELEKEQGWISVFDVLQCKKFKFAIVVIRQGLIESAMKIWPDAIVYCIENLKQINDIQSNILNLVLNC